jgi:hypothetical protein
MLIAPKLLNATDKAGSKQTITRCQIPLALICDLTSSPDHNPQCSVMQNYEVVKAFSSVNTQKA